MTQPSSDHPLSVAPFAGTVVVSRDGETIARSDNAMALMEATYPLVFYVPRDDVRMEMLAPSETVTHCPYKGDASYYSLKGAGEAGSDVAWSYETPNEAVAAIAGYLAFYQGKVVVQSEPAA